MEAIANARITFLGAGNMAEALVRGILNSGIVPPMRINVTDLREQRREMFCEKYGVNAFADNARAIEGATVCMLAMKPQDMGTALRSVSEAIPRNCLVVSIAAGVTTKALEMMLPEGQRVVRVMPNTPALIGKGVAGLCPGSHTSEEDIELAELILQSVGKTYVMTEEYMDAVTALTGTGPAYVFYFIEAMLKAAEEMGLRGVVARNMVYAMVEGSIHLLLETEENPAVLRERVTSKGGTSEAALRYMNNMNVSENFVGAMHAARSRSAELCRFVEKSHETE